MCLALTGWHAQAEAKQNNESVFRRSLLNRLQQEFKNREEMRECSLQEWVCFVTFICNIFDYLKVTSLSFSFGSFKHYLLSLTAFPFRFYTWQFDFGLLLVCRHIKVNNMPMLALVHPVYDCLMRLTYPDALLNEEEVRI